MSKPKMIKKASGEQELFSREKLENSLRRSGASDLIIEDILAEIKLWLYDGASTKKIYRRAFGLLSKQRMGMAARYSLKRAIMELGPTGYPFEQFMGKLMMHLGSKTEVGQLIQGKCVQHEVDVVVTGHNFQYLVECKYYNNQGKFADVKVPLYIRSRFEDIVAMRKSLPEYRDFVFHGWLVTNTRFTTDAMKYGNCAGLHLVSWDYPAGHSLKDMIEEEGLFPITALTTLNQEQKRSLLDAGIVLCRQIADDIRVLDKTGIEGNRKEKVLAEVADLVR